jgi:hypothetical protein
MLSLTEEAPRRLLVRTAEVRSDKPLGSWTSQLSQHREKLVRCAMVSDSRSTTILPGLGCGAVYQICKEIPKRLLSREFAVSVSFGKLVCHTTYITTTRALSRTMAPRQGPCSLCRKWRDEQELLPLHLPKLAGLLLCEVCRRTVLDVDTRTVHLRIDLSTVQALRKITQHWDLSALSTRKVKEAGTGLVILLSKPRDVSAEDDAPIRHDQALLGNGEPQFASMGIVHEKLQVLATMSTTPQTVAASAVPSW